MGRSGRRGGRDTIDEVTGCAIVSTLLLIVTPANVPHSAQPVSTSTRTATASTAADARAADAIRAADAARDLAAVERVETSTRARVALLADVECLDSPQSLAAHWPAILTAAACLGLSAVLAGSSNIGEARTTALASACGGLGVAVDVLTFSPPPTKPKLTPKPKWKMGRVSPVRVP